MARYNYVVISNPVAGREREYNDWYDAQHLPDVLAVPGFVAAQRFRVAQQDNPLSGGYVAIYEMETDDPQATLAALQSLAGTERMLMSDALDMDGITTALITPITPRLTR